MNLSIRQATLADVPALLACWRAARAEPTHTDDAASVGMLLSNDPQSVIVAERNGAIVGSVIAAWDGWRGSIYRLVVAPGERRRGLGSRLLRAAEKRLAHVGAVRLQAIVVEDDDRATGFWRQSGWVEQTKRIRFVRG